MKQHANLCDKRDKQWFNTKLRETVWKELAATFPNCTYLHVRKFFEAKRTDFDKIEKRESRSDAPARERTTREESIMSNWSFLGVHIAHETTQPSDRFPPSQRSSLSHMQLEPDPSPRRHTPDDDDSTSGLKDQESRSSLSVYTEIVFLSKGEHTLAGGAIKELLNTAILLTKKSELQGYEERSSNSVPT